MTGFFAAGITVAVLVEATDRHGDDTLTEVGTVGPCGWAPGDSTESEDGRDQVVTRRTLYTPPNSGITDQHRVRFPDGSLWRVDGDPGQWRSPFDGWVPGDEIRLERVRG